MLKRMTRGEANLNVGMAVVRAVAKFKMLGKKRAGKKSSEGSLATDMDAVKRSPSDLVRAIDMQKAKFSREEAIAYGKGTLKQRCKFLGIEEMEVDDDGNCQFRAISQELYNTQEYHLAVRKQVCKIMKDREDEYKILFDEGKWDPFINQWRGRTRG